jgi:acetyl esterase/lipase
MKKLVRLFSHCFFILGFVAASLRALPPGTRLPSLEDELNSETLDAVVPSPDGTFIAAVVLRPQIGGENYRSGLGQDRASLLIIPTDGSPRTTISEKAKGCFAPVWSPDGQRLAFLHTNGEKVRVGVWERTGKSIRRFENAIVGLGPAADPVINWIDNDHVVFLQSAASAGVALSYSRSATERRMFQQWELQARGELATKSVLDVRDLSAKEADRWSVASLDIHDGNTTVLGRATIAFVAGVAKVLWSPMRDAVAILSAKEPVPYQDRVPHKEVGQHFARLPLIPIAGTKRWAVTIVPLVPGEAGSREFDAGTAEHDNPPAAVWSGDGRELGVFLGRKQDAPSREAFVVTVRTGVMRSVSLPDSAEARAQPLATRFWPDAPRPKATVSSQLPDSHFRIVWTDERTGVVLYRSTERGPCGLPPSGAVLGSRQRNGDVRTLLAINESRAALREPVLKVFDYRSLDNTALKGIYILPENYEPGKRYPLVVIPYPGSFFVPTMEKPNLNYAMLAAAGYAVLVPSIPLTDGVSDPMLDLPKGVLPAVDELVAMGIADSNRVGLIGTSYGGYSVMTLITSSSRFRAAVSIVGVFNQASSPAETSVSGYKARYDASYAVPLLLQRALFQGNPGKGRMFEDNAWGYVRNSPFYLLDRVSTPLLLIHGDWDDAASLDQSDQAFASLFRLGKHVRYVRYFGEDHVFSSPANRRDSWNEILDWFRAHLGGA